MLLAELLVNEVVVLEDPELTEDLEYDELLDGSFCTGCGATAARFNCTCDVQ